MCANENKIQYRQAYKIQNNLKSEILSQFHRQTFVYIQFIKISNKLYSIYKISQNKIQKYYVDFISFRNLST